jgi:AcrR family transcriptional regulator
LREALLSLLEERDIASISVLDIVQRAEINRATFYLHYEDKDAFVAQALDALFEDLVGGVRSFIDSHSAMSADEPPRVLVDLYRTMAERPALYRRLLSDTSPGSFTARLLAFLESEFLRHWPDLDVAVEPGEAPPDLRARYAAYANLGVMHWWLEHSNDEVPETVTSWQWQLMRPVWFAHPGKSEST